MTPQPGADARLRPPPSRYTVAGPVRRRSECARPRRLRGTPHRWWGCWASTVPEDDPDQLPSGVHEQVNVEDAVNGRASGFSDPGYRQPLHGFHRARFLYAGTCSVLWGPDFCPVAELSAASSPALPRQDDQSIVDRQPRRLPSPGSRCAAIVDLTSRGRLDFTGTGSCTTQSHLRVRVALMITPPRLEQAPDQPLSCARGTRGPITTRRAAPRSATGARDRDADSSARTRRNAGS